MYIWIYMLFIGAKQIKLIIMKKLLSFLTLSVLMLTVMSSCKKTPDNSGKPKISIASSWTEVAPGGSAPFTITSSVAPESDIVVNVSSDNTSAATVPNELTIKAGDTSVSGTITGVAPGDAEISISSSGAEIEVGSINIKVTDNPVIPEVVELTLKLSTTTAGMNSSVNFTVSSPGAPEKDIPITVTSSNTAAATVPAALTLKAGSKEVSGQITTLAIGESNITISADGVDIAVATIKLTVVEKLDPLEYCTITINYDYSCLISFKLGDKTIEAGSCDYYTGEAPLASDFVIKYSPEATAGEPTGSSDSYTLQIYADWHRTGTFTRVYNQEITAGTSVKDYSGTLDIPADAAVSSTIRVISSYTPGLSLVNGCGEIESGTVIDVVYTK